MAKKSEFRLNSRNVNKRSRNYANQKLNDYYELERKIKESMNKQPNLKKEFKHHSIWNKHKSVDIL